MFWAQTFPCYLLCYVHVTLCTLYLYVMYTLCYVHVTHRLKLRKRRSHWNFKTREACLIEGFELNLKVLKFELFFFSITFPQLSQMPP